MGQWTLEMEVAIWQEGKKNNDTQGIEVITKYNNQHRAVRKIIGRFWHHLRIDPLLSLLCTTESSNHIPMGRLTKGPFCPE